MAVWIVLSPFCAGAICAALCGFLQWGRSLWALLSAVCTAAGVLSGLALGWGLNGLLFPALAMCAAAFAALRFGKEGDG